MKNLATALSLTLMLTSITLATPSEAAVYSSHGKARAGLQLSRTNKDGFEKRFSGSFLGKLFGKKATFEVTPSDNNYMIPGRGPNAHQKIELSYLSFNYHESDWGYSEDWQMSALLTSENLKTLIETACNIRCQKQNPDVAEWIASLTSKSGSTYSITSSFSAYHGDTIGWADTDSLKSTLSFETSNGETLNLTLKFPRNWHLYDESSD